MLTIYGAPAAADHPRPAGAIVADTDPNRGSERMRNMNVVSQSESWKTEPCRRAAESAAGARVFGRSQFEGIPVSLENGSFAGSSQSVDELSRLLVSVACHRDRAAFGLLFMRIAPRLKTFLIRSGMTTSIAEDVVQETMLTVWRRAGYFDPARAGAATWIFTIARNLRIDRHRRDMRAGIGELDAPEESDTEPDPQTSVEALSIASQRSARVKTALGTLSDEQAAVVRLSFFGDASHSEIARALGLPLGTVKSRVRLAMNRLRGLLEDL